MNPLNRAFSSPAANGLSEVDDDDGDQSAVDPSPILAHYRGVLVQIGTQKGTSSRNTGQRGSSGRGARSIFSGRSAGRAGATELQEASADSSPRAEDEVDAMESLRRLLGTISVHARHGDPRREQDNMRAPKSVGTARRLHDMAKPEDLTGLPPDATLAPTLSGWRTRTRAAVQPGLLSVDTAALMFFGKLVIEHAPQLAPTTLKQSGELLAICDGLAALPGPDRDGEPHAQRALNLLLPLWLLNLGRPRTAPQRRRALERLDALRCSR
jgi:hypothetical protein